MKLTLLCGIPGSGKSTDAKRLDFDGHLVLSSDEMRAVIGAGESDQGVSGKVFETLEYCAKYWLRRGRDVVIDATNYNRKSRERFVQIGKQMRANIIAYVFRTPLAECKRRNAARPRVVPEHVLERMHAGFEIPIAGDEVDEVIYR
jgi:predicted kinase